LSINTDRSHFYAATLRKSLLLVSGILFYAFLSLSWLPYGLNFRSLKFLSFMLWPVFAVLFILSRFYKLEHNPLALKPNTYDISNFILVLLPMTPILRFILANQDILSNNESAGIFFFFLLGTLVYAYFIPTLLSIRWFHLEEFTILGLSFSFSLFLSPYLSSCHYFYQTLLIPLSIFVSLVACFVFYLSDRKLSNLILYTIILLGLAFFLFVLPYLNSSYHSNKLLLLPFSLFSTFLFSYGLFVFDRKLLKLMVTVLFISTLFNVELSNQTRQVANLADNVKSKIQMAGKNRQMISKPDIFLLTYESYVGNETARMYGIDNSAQEAYLTQNGFKIYRGIYTIGPSSKVTMNAVLNISSDEKSSRDAISGNGFVQRLLQYHGYETYGIFSSNDFFWGKSLDYDHCFPATVISEQVGASVVLTLAILQGEFRFDAGFNELAYPDYILQKGTALALPKQDHPRFIYTHNRYPGHSRYSGELIVGDEIDLYKLGLQKANAEMKSDVEAVIKSNPDSIIIINGDHGPYLTQKVKDINSIGRINIQDNYGVFLAIKWPDNLHVDDKSLSVLQDIFPVILNALFNTEEFSNIKVAPKTLQPETVAGAIVNNGIIIGGKDDGKPLYESSIMLTEPE